MHRFIKSLRVEILPFTTHKLPPLCEKNDLLFFVFLLFVTFVRKAVTDKDFTIRTIH